VNVVADEDVDGPIVQRLRADGHDVLYIAEFSPSVVDDDVLGQANERGALLVTADKDFGELVFRRRLVHSGVLLLRLEGLTNPTKAEIVGEVFRDRGQELLGAFSVVSPRQIRIRRTP
jgi:predicted nuclease of predicted toxin-antitoxin system